MRQRGFTLLEITVVIAIIALLVSILLLMRPHVELQHGFDAGLVI